MWKVEQGEGSFECGNLGRETPYQVLIIWIVHAQGTIRRSGTGRVVGIVDGSIYEGVDVNLLTVWAIATWSQEADNSKRTQRVTY
jgi:hypothetical protein